MDEGDDKEGEDDGDYSSDFEESNASFRGSPRSKQRGGQTITTKETGTEAEKKKKKLAISVEDNYGREVSEAESEPLPSARESQPLPPPSYSSSIPSSASLQQPTHWPEEVREENSDSVLRAEMALQPLRSSLAKSLLSSQVMKFFHIKYVPLHLQYTDAEQNNRNYSGVKSNLYVCDCRCPHH